MKQNNAFNLILILFSFQLHINGSWLSKSINNIKEILKKSNNLNVDEYHNYLDSDFDAYTKGYYVPDDPENLPNNTVNPTYSFEDQSSFENLPFAPNCLFDVVLKQSENESIINNLEAKLKKLETSETTYIHNIQTMYEIPDDFGKKLENIEKKKQKIKNKSRNYSLLPVLKIELTKNSPAFYQLYHTKELALEKKEIACGSYMIAFALAIHEILNQGEPKNFLWKGALEECTPKYFEQIDHMLEIFDIIERINTIKKTNNLFNTFTYFFLNFDNTSNSISLFDPYQLETEIQTLEENIQKEIQEKIKTESTKKTVYLMYRIGQNNNNMGHWSLFACSKKNPEQQGIYYVDNMNTFIESTTLVAKYIQGIFNSQ